jgi:5'-phosphate synthase pdxT subunit
MGSKPVVGVLALQGDFSLHAELLEGLGVDAIRVRRGAELLSCDGLVLPGGESTTLQRLLRVNDLVDPLLEYGSRRPLLGTCAGLILVSTHLENAGGVVPLGLVDITAVRNGYGRQVDSFEAELEPVAEDVVLAGKTRPIGIFIRAPRILRVGAAAQVLAVYGQEPVAVRQGHHVALTFHPEVARDPRWHRAWLRTWTAA